MHASYKTEFGGLSWMVVGACQILTAGEDYFFVFHGIDYGDHYHGLLFATNFKMSILNQGPS